MTRHDQSNFTANLASRLGNTPKRVVVAGLVAGGILTSAVVASADTPSNTSDPKVTASAFSSQTGQHDGSGLDLNLNLGRDRGTVLSGTDASNVRDAVYAKDPNMTIQQMTNDPRGGFQARGLTSDGSHITLQLNDQYTVIGSRSTDANQNNSEDRGLLGNLNGSQGNGLFSNPDNSQNGNSLGVLP